MSRGGDGWGRRMALGLLVGMTVATVVAFLACGDGGDDDQTGVDAQVEAIADQTEAKGWLRPIFPSYVLRGLEPLPVVFEGSETTVSFNYPPLDDAGPSDEPRPFDLAIAQGTADIYDSCTVEDDDPDFACVEVGDVRARLQTTDRGDGMVDYYVSFELDDRTVRLEAI
jgi:hypothetical protein